MNKNVLVTGASGFIGKHLIRKLIENRYKVICFDMKFDSGFIDEFEGKLEMVQGNLLDNNSLNNLINNYSPEYVFHLAGSKNRTNSPGEFKTSMEINYLGTLNLFNALVGCQSLKLVTLLGTIEEYGHSHSPFTEESLELPNSAYGLSKLSATKLALIYYRQFNLPVVVFRLSIAYGHEQGTEMFIPALVKSMLLNKEFKMTEGNQLRDFIYINDLITALIKGMSSNKLKGEIVNLASGESVKLKDIAIQIASMINGNHKLKIGSLPYREGEIMDYSVDVSKAASLLHWLPLTSLSEGMEKTILSYKRELNDKA